MKSMTGYGSGTATCDGSSLTLEIKSVNGKQRDIRCNLPTEFAAAEAELLVLIHEHVARGSVLVSATFTPSPELRKSGLRVDAELAEAVVAKLRAVAARTGIDTTLSVADLLNVPGFISVRDTCLDADTARHLLLAAGQEALLAFDEGRRAEGGDLRADLNGHCAHLETLLASMRDRQDDVLRRYRDRLLDRVRLLEVEVTLDDERLAKEVAFAAQRSDIAEELSRLDSHLKTFRQLLGTGDEPVGRQLQFVCQEIHREINTLGSKTSETDTAKEGIQFKTTLEKIREQIANVE
ncbi:MAG: YicC/YloC family endoribonuclease [Lentisphaeria bacterium]|nr:YicC/YloC family endoribonuclease [Lentisphaeria bacterium]